jgi:hypothetical protein
MHNARRYAAAGDAAHDGNANADKKWHCNAAITGIA